METMNISDKGISFIKSYEKCALSPYICPAGKATIGWGNTFYEDGTIVRINDSAISPSRADRLFSYMITKFENEVAKLTHQSFSQNQYDAIMSFAYNCGVANLASSTLLKKANLNQNDSTISDEFKKWNHSNGKVLDGLTDRRNKESDIYSKNIYVNHV